MDEQVVLVPFGAVDPELLLWLGERLKEKLGHPWRIAETLPLPPWAYDPRREQYRSYDLLVLLEEMEIGAWRILGVANADLYDPRLNFVLGQARMGGRAAIIALARLHPSFYQRSGIEPGWQEKAGRRLFPERHSFDTLATNEALFRERVLKEAIHELGHTLGLGHCHDWRCVMHFSNAVADTDQKMEDFCPRCREQIKGQAPRK